MHKSILSCGLVSSSLPKLKKEAKRSLKTCFFCPNEVPKRNFSFKLGQMPFIKSNFALTPCWNILSESQRKIFTVSQIKQLKLSNKNQPRSSTHNVEQAQHKTKNHWLTHAKIPCTMLRTEHVMWVRNMHPLHSNYHN